MTAFCVHAAPDDAVQPHRVEAADFLDAALLFAERWLHPEGDDAVTLYVQDEDSGEERCLRLDLADAADLSVRACDEAASAAIHRRAA